MHPMLPACPNCGAAMTVTRLSCTNCETAVSARFETSACGFCQLQADSLAFLADFVRLRGNLRELARDREMSYWTARTRLNEIIAELGYEAPDDGAEDENRELTRMQVIERLQAGEITADEAAEQLRGLRG